MPARTTGCRLIVRAVPTRVMAMRMADTACCLPDTLRVAFILRARRVLARGWRVAPAKCRRAPLRALLNSCGGCRLVLDASPEAALGGPHQASQQHQAG